MRNPEGIEAPGGLDEEPEASCRPLLAAEEREALRREWLAGLRAGGAGEGRRAAQDRAPLALGVAG